jgi:hypothetical protein
MTGAQTRLLKLATAFTGDNSLTDLIRPGLSFRYTHPVNVEDRTQRNFAFLTKGFGVGRQVAVVLSHRYFFTLSPSSTKQLIFDWLRSVASRHRR